MEYNRLLLKLSGEAFAPESGFGISGSVMRDTARQIRELYETGYEISIVVGGGNFWRGRNSEHMDRTTADHIGMLATIINGLALQDAIEELAIPTRVLTAVEMPKIAEPYIRRRAIKHIEASRIVIFSGGTGNPFFSTDTAAALRASEIEADIVLFAKTINGVYDKDPAIFPMAKRFERISYKELLNMELGVMDQTAATLLKENDIPSLVFKMRGENSLLEIINNPEKATVISG